MSNTPFAYAVCSVLHRSVEFKAESSHLKSTYALSGRSKRYSSLVSIWSTECNKIGFLTRSDRPVRCLACPARFERATYALEGRCSIQLSYRQYVCTGTD